MFLALLASGIVLFLGFGLTGFFNPSLNAWKYSDIIYYPLAAAGVVLIVFSPAVRPLESIRQSYDAEFDRILKEQQRTIESLPYMFSDSDIRSSKSWIELIRDDPALCAEHKSEPICAQALEFEPLAKLNIQAILAATPSDLNSTREICKTFKESVIAIDESGGIASIVSRRVLPIILDLQEKKSRLINLENLNGYIDKLVEEEVTQWKTDVGNVPEIERIVDNVATATRYQIYFVLANDKCFEIGSEEFSAMSTLVSSFDEKRAAVANQLQKDLDSQSRWNLLNVTIERIGTIGWKFVLLLAMSLKFGAAMSRLRS